MQPIVTQQRLVVLFAALFSLGFVKSVVLARRGLTVAIAIADDGRADKQHQVPFGDFLTAGAEKGADNRNIPEQRHFIRGIGDAFVQQSTDHHRFAAAHQHRIIHRAGVEGGP